ncbi:MAG: hypothetical protein P8Z35_20540, partial [Ignavibacteriaceae bacterium]
FLFFLFSISICAQVKPDNPGVFIISAEHVSSFSDEWNNSQTPHSTAYWDTVKSFGLNYASLLYHQVYKGKGNMQVSKILADLSRANNEGIKVFLWNGFNWDMFDSKFKDPKRWVYQVENNNDDFLYHGTGGMPKSPAPFPEAETHWGFAIDSNLNKIPDYCTLRRSINSAGDVVKNLRQDHRQPDNDTVRYFVKVRMRLPDRPAAPQNVLLVEIKNKITGAVESGIINSGAFKELNVWTDIPVFDFIKTADGPISPKALKAGIVPSDSVKYTPYDIRVYWYGLVDCDIDFVMIDNSGANSLYNHVYDAAMTDFVNNYDTCSAMRYFKIWDEPKIENWYPVRYMNDYIQQKLNAAGYPEKSTFTYQTYSSDLSNFVPRRYLFETRMNKDISDRYPVFLNTAKPGSADYINSIQSRFDKNLIPYLSCSIEEANRKSLPFYFCVQAHKWDIPPDHQKLAGIGNELISLTWQGTKSWANGKIAGIWNNTISNITTNIEGETKYVETGHFLKNGTDYFYIVNRRTIPTEQRNITVTFNKRSSHTTWRVTEVGTNNTWIISNTGNFQTTYQPGEGKLFTFEPF